jgi:hypothetical protein
VNKYVIASVVVLLTVVGLYRYGHHNGWTERDQEMQLEIARKNDEARAKEQAMADVITTKDEELRKANLDVDKKQTALNAAIRAGRVRLPAPSCVQASPSAPAAPRDSPEEGAKPDRPVDQATDAERETLRLIAEIAADGDRAINQLNACIAAYDEMRSIVNGQR